MYNLMSAAAAAGVNRSTVLRAIKAGRISAQRDSNNNREIDPAEFHRVFPPLPLPAAASAQPDQQQIDGQVALLRNLVEQLRNDMEAREADHHRREEDLRRDRDHLARGTKENPGRVGNDRGWVALACRGWAPRHQQSEPPPVSKA